MPALSPVQTGTFQHGGYQLAYELYGNAGTPCLLMHGILLDSHMNRDLARRLASEGYQVALLDLLGHGRSDKPIEAIEHRIDFYAAQALAALDHLGFERALVGGVSLGAITALQLAERAPERLLGLFIEMPVMEWSTPTAALLLTPLMLAVRYGSGLYRPFARLLRKLPRTKYEVLNSAVNGLSQEPEVIAAVLHGILVGPVVPSVTARRAIRVPTLVIGHGGDGLHHLGDAEALARQIPDARFLRARSILEMRIRPQRLWPQIRDFLGQIQQQAGASGLRSSA